MTVGGNYREETKVSETRGFVRFLVALIAPFILVLGGAGLASLGFTNGWTILGVAGLIITGVGLLWGILMLIVTDAVSLF